MRFLQYVNVQNELSTFDSFFQYLYQNDKRSVNYRIVITIWVILSNDKQLEDLKQGTLWPK